MNNLQQSMLEAERLRQDGGYITNADALALVENHGYQFARYYVDTCRWVRVCEFVSSGSVGFDYYAEQRETNNWKRMPSNTHPRLTEQVALANYVASGLKE